MPVNKIPMNEESEVPMIYLIPDDNINLYEGYYHGVYAFLSFKKEGGVDRKEE